ncbi:hypothetical protein ACFWXO_39795, partial [Kitasatospora sp. NPDC059088]
LTFRCRAVGGEARVNDDESLEVGWFGLDELPPIGDIQHHPRPPARKSGRGTRSRWGHRST